MVIFNISFCMFTRGYPFSKKLGQPHRTGRRNSMEEEMPTTGDESLGSLELLNSCGSANLKWGTPFQWSFV